MTTNKATRNRVIATVRELDPDLDEQDDGFKAAMVLVAGLMVGPITSKVSELTKLPLAFVEKCASNLEASGVWKDGKTHADWDDPEQGGWAFWMDVLVAEGMLERR